MKYLLTFSFFFFQFISGNSIAQYKTDIKLCKDLPYEEALFLENKNFGEFSLELIINEEKKYAEDNLEPEQEEDLNSQSNANNIEINFENDIEVDTRPRIGVVPLKCHHCNLNYSYLIVCGKCYQKSGMKYICDECDG